jgi:hypothetical protein
MYHQNHTGEGTMVPWSEVVVVIELVSSKSIRLTLMESYATYQSHP